MYVLVILVLTLVSNENAMEKEEYKIKKLNLSSSRSSSPESSYRAMNTSPTLNSPVNVIQQTSPKVRKGSFLKKALSFSNVLTHRVEKNNESIDQQLSIFSSALDSQNDKKCIPTLELPTTPKQSPSTTGDSPKVENFSNSASRSNTPSPKSSPNSKSNTSSPKSNSNSRSNSPQASRPKSPQRNFFKSGSFLRKHLDKNEEKNEESIKVLEVKLKSVQEKTMHQTEKEPWILCGGALEMYNKEIDEKEKILQGIIEAIKKKNPNSIYCKDRAYNLLYDYYTTLAQVSLNGMKYSISKKEMNEFDILQQKYKYYYNGAHAAWIGRLTVAWPLNFTEEDTQEIKNEIIKGHTKTINDISTGCLSHLEKQFEEITKNKKL